jgi:hypothetical protein
LILRDLRNQHFGSPDSSQRCRKQAQSALITLGSDNTL